MLSSHTRERIWKQSKMKGIEQHQQPRELLNFLIPRRSIVLASFPSGPAEKEEQGKREVCSSRRRRRRRILLFPSYFSL